MFLNQQLKGWGGQGPSDPQPHPPPPRPCTPLTSAHNLRGKLLMSIAVLKKTDGIQGFSRFFKAKYSLFQGPITSMK